MGITTVDPAFNITVHLTPKRYGKKLPPIEAFGFAPSAELMIKRVAEVYAAADIEIEAVDAVPLSPAEGAVTLMAPPVALSATELAQAKNAAGVPPMYRHGDHIVEDGFEVTIPRALLPEHLRMKPLKLSHATGDFFSHAFGMKPTALAQYCYLIESTYSDKKTKAAISVIHLIHAPNPSAAMKDANFHELHLYGVQGFDALGDDDAEAARTKRINKAATRRVLGRFRTTFDAEQHLTAIMKSPCPPHDAVDSPDGSYRSPTLQAALDNKAASDAVPIPASIDWCDLDDL